MGGDPNLLRGHPLAHLAVAVLQGSKEVGNEVDDSFFSKLAAACPHDFAQVPRREVHDEVNAIGIFKGRVKLDDAGVT